MNENARESLEVDVLFVGAGPANLAAAYHLAQLVARHNESASTKLEPMIAVIEKSGEVGDHILSGAVLDPRALREIIPDFAQAPPFKTQVAKENLLFLTRRGSFRAPIVPGPMNNHGNYVVSLSDLTKWLAEKVTAMGVQIFCGFPGREMLYDAEDRVIGVRTGDKGVDREGKRKANYEAGVDLRAKVTVLGEGSRGSLCKELFAHKQMYSKTHPMIYGIGVKELWEVQAGRMRPGEVVHTLGFPLRSEEYGGSFVYALSETEISVGLVVGLDYKDPFLDAHARLQQLKTHPAIRRLIEGGKLLKYGAATLPEGGYYTMPQLYHEGVLVVGDSASFLNGMRLKGIHLAMKSGMLAAETVLEALVQGDSSERMLAGYKKRFESSWAHEELYKTRNFHQAFQGGLWPGLFHAGLQMLSGGRGLRDPWPEAAGHEHMRTVEEYYGKAYSATAGENGARPPEPAFDGILSFDKLTSVYHADTGHEEDQPCHLQVRDLDLCHNRCTAEYGNPCQHFCPAKVYEWLPRESPDENGRRFDFSINFTNCVHCKTCDIMDPYQIIDWVTPEGGGGPHFSKM
jgi:electron-transferring-flavoprotein dehydrogenase